MSKLEDLQPSAGALGVGGQIAHGDSFYSDRHPELHGNASFAEPLWVLKDGPEEVRTL
jgi:hypothetical protein